MGAKRSKIWKLANVVFCICDQTCFLTQGFSNVFTRSSVQSDNMSVLCLAKYFSFVNLKGELQSI